MDIIYFQGPSIKGLSGSPVISLNDGSVVGILTVKLTGIDRELRRAAQSIPEQRSERIQPGTTIVGNINLMPTLKDIISTLDNQLANGFGAATGIDDAKYEVRRAEEKRKQR